MASTDSRDAENAEATENALIGLLGWLAVVERPASVRCGAGADTRVFRLPRAVSKAFQAGFIDEIGPFLAYPDALWWFSRAWKAMAAGPAGIGLIADYAEPFAVLLVSDWPQSMTAFAALCALPSRVGLYPYAASYLAAFDGPSASKRPRTVGEMDDLDLSRGCVLAYDSEASWLQPLLQYPSAA